MLHLINFPCVLFDSIEPNSSSRHKRKTLTWYKYIPCQKATWVPADSIPKAVMKKIVQGQVQLGKLRHVILRKRAIVGPRRAHEQLAPTNSIKSIFASSSSSAPNDVIKPWQITEYNFLDVDNADSDKAEHEDFNNRKRSKVISTYKHTYIYPFKNHTMRCMYVYAGEQYSYGHKDYGIYSTDGSG